MDLRLDGQTALITGGSAGIGKGIAKAFADAGAQVMITSRKADKCEAALADIGGDSDYIASHIGQLEEAERVIDGTIERFKSRFVACGYSQVEGEDYSHSFSATMRASRHSKQERQKKNQAQRA